MATFEQWLAGTRPRTLTASVVPVLVGTALAVTVSQEGDLDSSNSWTGDLSASRFCLTLLLALLLQVGVNYANDYSDGVKGSDQNRQGPMRLVASETAQPGQVLLAAWLCFSAAGALGIILSFWVGWEVLPVVVAAIAAAWFYTGGPRPYGYYALGEVSVFIFFGLVPTAGTVYLQTSEIAGDAIVAGAGVGLVACALLIANNLRDVKSDKAVKKQTLAVVVADRFGEIWARRLYPAAWLGAGVAVVALSIGEVNQLWVLLGLTAPLLAVKPILVTLRAPFILEAHDSAAETATRQLLGVLATTGKLLLVYGVTLGAGLWLPQVVG